MQEANLWCLPENYGHRYYLFHFATWPELSFVAVLPNGRVVGYVLAKMSEEAETASTGHITSLAVLRSHRKQGLARNLMEQTQRSMADAYQATGLSLHVRITNRAAYGLCVASPLLHTCHACVVSFRVCLFHPLTPSPSPPPPNVALWCF